ncbi:ABR067Cp [Eremothecium gossypii ATCC 10895]|uniref:Peroxisome assembly protein 12 n=1 Tax=Eremothecium gossypii (strain ATCC 10895 / CBS 109.51 / FGSC 9923 / NRRL Y-1056) TaxID=284811 RepID=Q75DF9_EREGS|nr:ABR067Cp [Eremothecium gossypii ATCC 10895]AAS50837.1 ABR067Cp [Eremothecium gossypii ATCC 10895]AEY95126.1 FABR067Cp [Eremothecium gossypii FDAG1]
MDFYSNLPVDATATPTLFEITSSHEIDGLLKPTFQYLSANAIQRAPTRARIMLHSRFDELYALLKLLLEYYHLDKYNATFIEKYYGLQRESVAGGVAGARLSRGQVAVVLCEKVAAVYVRDKLDQLHGRLYGRRLTAKLSAWERWFVRWYPHLKKLVAVASLLCKLRYLSGRSRATSVLDYLAGIQYARLSQPAGADAVAAAGAALARPVRTNWPRIRELIYRFLKTTGGALGVLTSELFPTFIFTVRLLQQWSQQPTKKQDPWDTLSSAPPAPRPEVLVHGDAEATDAAEGEPYISVRCPVCRSAVSNPGVLQTGYIACYPCAVRYVEKHGKCPVMQTPLLGGPRGIRKLIC